MEKWTNAKDKVTLELGNGSPADCPEGLPRTFTATFTCDPNVHITKDDYTKATFTATNPAGTCQYDFNIPTCIACDAGCKSETTLFEIFLIVFIIVVCVYLLAGILLNKFYFKSEELIIDCKDYYFSNVIARSSKTMLDCYNSKAKIKKTGTDG